jgi:hypothetical protein
MDAVTLHLSPIMMLENKQQKRLKTARQQRTPLWKETKKI